MTYYRRNGVARDGVGKVSKLELKALARLLRSGHVVRSGSGDFRWVSYRIKYFDPSSTQVKSIVEIKRLIELIHEYQSKVKEALDLFDRYKGLKQPKHPLEWQTLGISQTGYLDPNNKIFYFLHGDGCCIHLQSGRVDWDFGGEGQIDGFDLFRLHEFVDRGTQNFPEFRDQEKLKAVFAEAESKGLIQKSVYVLYYLNNIKLVGWVEE